MQSLQAIAPNSVGGFVVIFDPKDLGVRNATISIVSNDTTNSPYTFAIRGNGVAELFVESGDYQRVAISSLFGQSLTVKAVGDRQNPLDGVEILYSAPESGASATLPSTSAITDSDGLASIRATANDILGSYAITAMSPGTNTVLFNISNGADRYGDIIPDADDNCVEIPNANQLDTDNDMLGDVCDNDADNDTVSNQDDNGPLVSNIDQADENPSTLEGDACEPDDLCLPIKTKNDAVAVICF